MSWLRPVGFVGLGLALLITAFLTLRSAGPRPKPASAAASARAPRLGEPPPEEVDRSPAAAQRYVEQQSCLSECASAANLCAASNEEGAEGCTAAKAACDAKCR
jgi:hypothetical protein